MYTALLQVIFVTCVQINSTEKGKQKQTNNFCHLGPKNLNWNKHSQTQHQNKVLFPLRLRLDDKFNKLNKRATRKFRCFPRNVGEVEICVSDATVGASMPVDCICHKGGIFIALFAHPFIYSFIHSSLHRGPQNIPVCRNILPSEIQKKKRAFETFKIYIKKKIF